MINSNLGAFDRFHILIKLLNQIITGLRAACSNPGVLAVFPLHSSFYQNTECVVCAIQPNLGRQEGSSVLVRYLELQLHACDVLSGLHLSQFLDVGEEAASGDLRVAAGDCLQQGIMDEAVLILSLHHVVPLGTHQRHVTVDVHGLLVLDAL